ncbi:MAG: carboxyl transferase [Oscillospiraceae bacterium]|nr:carboxyl transferase [Oscillospiraceae bacterium]
MITKSREEQLAEYMQRGTPAHDRLALLFDEGQYTEFGSGFRGRSGDSVITAYGYIGGTPAYAFAQNSDSFGGAVDRQHAEKIAAALDLAARNGMPVIGIYDSHGAFTDDGAEALNAYSLILSKMTELSGVVPTVSVISGICSGSMSLIAASADITVMTDKAELYLDSGDKSDKETAGALGVLQMCAADDSEAFEKVRKYISLMPQNNLSAAPEYEYDAPVSASFADAEQSALSLADEGSVLELSCCYADAAYTALATVNGTAVGIAATNRSKEKLTADDMAKLARFVRLCDAYGIPVVTVVDTQGIDSKGSALRSLARLSGAYSEAVCPKITLISGTATGPVFTALCGKNISADAVYALPEAVIAPIAPLTAAEFLYHDRLAGVPDTASARQAIADEYAANEASAFCAAEKGAVDTIVTAENARAAVASALDFSAGKRLLRRMPRKHSLLPM